MTSSPSHSTTTNRGGRGIRRFARAEELRIIRNRTVGDFLVPLSQKWDAENRNGVMLGGGQGGGVGRAQGDIIFSGTADPRVGVRNILNKCFFFFALELSLILVQWILLCANDRSPTCG